ncbi:winged helix-turn-helix domain-containing protein [Georgenia sp. MJ173]|uniref:ArsR/SmtB family transcription factor n=1 Tax=Georgenia sunbinii TaxID=3117728 RepID=UPI002F26BED1
MSPKKYESISDPERIRAMAHPLRLELLDVLHEVGEATATECAARVGESVASCSFHLRTLEKYGYVERAEPRGREKPWRVVHRSLRTEPAPDVPGSLHATTELARMSFGRQAERLAAALDHLPREPQEWLDATALITSTVWATAEEAADLARGIKELLDGLAEREDDPASRPAGVRRVRLLSAVYADPPSETP